MTSKYSVLMVAMFSGQAWADSEAAQCTYTLTDAKPGWTAFKTTEKVGVSGSFKDYTLSSSTPGSTLSETLKGVKMSIVPSSVDSGVEIRNQTIATKYFAAFAPDTPFAVTVESVSGDEKAGTATLKVDINGAQKTLDFPYTVNEAGELTAKATMEMMDFGLKTAFDGIHLACEALHKGADGVSKTWTDVDLSVTAKISKTCE